MRTKDEALWTQIRKDFLSSGLSFSQIVKKYNVSLSTLKKVAAREGWTTRRELVESVAENRIKEPPKRKQSQKEPKKTKKEPQKEPEPEQVEAELVTVPPEPETIEAMAGIVLQEKTRYDRFMAMTDGLANRIEDALAIVEPDNVYAITLLARALKDLRDLQRLNKDALDIEEQQARIAKLRSDTRIVESEDVGGIIVLPEIDEKPQPPEGEA